MGAQLAREGRRADSTPEKLAGAPGHPRGGADRLELRARAQGWGSLGSAPAQAPWLGDLGQVPRPVCLVIGTSANVRCPKPPESMPG